mmetsp:Transcript_44642/g.95969  ORF Transcript_44642/g.95969 Transcript_44642/m.95969 type:complete len:238 (-) Transcript_44642:517-1230(-)
MRQHPLARRSLCGSDADLCREALSIPSRTELRGEVLPLALRHAAVPLAAAAGQPRVRDLRGFRDRPCQVQAVRGSSLHFPAGEDSSRQSCPFCRHGARRRPRSLGGCLPPRCRSGLHGDCGLGRREEPERRPRPEASKALRAGLGLRGGGGLGHAKLEKHQKGRLHRLRTARVLWRQRALTGVLGWSAAFASRRWGLDPAKLRLLTCTHLSCSSLGGCAREEWRCEHWDAGWRQRPA